MQSSFARSNFDQSKTIDGSNWFDQDPSISLIFLSKKNLTLEHRYLEQSNSINGPVNNKITISPLPCQTRTS